MTIAQQLHDLDLPELAQEWNAATSPLGIERSYVVASHNNGNLLLHVVPGTNEKCSNLDGPVVHRLRAVDPMGHAEN